MYASNDVEAQKSWSARKEYNVERLNIRHIRPWYYTDSSDFFIII